METPPTKHTTQGSTQRRLFQSSVLTSIFGISVANMITRVVIILAAVGTLAIITAGLLQSNTPASTSITFSQTTHTGMGTQQAPVGFQVGDAAPNFTLTSPDGKKISLSDYRGKPVMLNFWYATCPGCLAEIPGMQKYYAQQQAAGKGFVILGVNVVDDAPTATQFAHQEGMTYPIVLDENQRVEMLYNVNATPMSYFIDGRGIIRSVVTGPVDDTTLRQNIAQIS